MHIKKMVSAPQLPFPAEEKVLVDLSLLHTDLWAAKALAYKVFSFENCHVWQLLCAVSCVPSLGQKTQQEGGEVCVSVHHNK